MELPLDILRIIEACEGARSGKADDSSAEWGYTWEDVIEVARTGDHVRRTKGIKSEALHVWHLLGRDTCGRLTYMQGKVTILDGRKVWYVISIHPPK